MKRATGADEALHRQWFSHISPKAVFIVFGIGALVVALALTFVALELTSGKIALEQQQSAAATCPAGYSLDIFNRCVSGDFWLPTPANDPSPWLRD